MSRIKVILASLIPVVGLFIWCARIYLTTATGTVVEFNVRGYDPRDLLAGHYIRYTVDYGDYPVCQDVQDDPAHCICLETMPESGIAVASWSGACRQNPDCDLVLAGRCQHSRFLADIERFYIPEQYAQVLMVAPPDSTIRVVIGNRKGYVVDYLVNGEGVQDYAMRKLRELPAPSATTVP